MTDDPRGLDDVGEDLASVFGAIPVGAAPDPTMVRRRARRRSNRRRGVAGLAAAGVIGLGVVLSGGDAATDVDIANQPEQTNPVPTSMFDTNFDDTNFDDTNFDDTEWRWVGSDQMLSLDGSPGGYGVRAGSTDHLTIFFEDGGVCFNADSCASIDRSYDVDNLAEAVASGRLDRAIFDPTNTVNPFAGWSAVYVPSSTGDLHGGTNPAVEVPGEPEPLAMVGANNVVAMLAETAPQFPNVEQVILAGTGTGGLGALLNYEAVVAAFPEARVDVLMDSVIVPQTQALLPDCFFRRISAGWPQEYPEDWDRFVSRPQDQKFAGIYEYLATKYPDATFGLFSSGADAAVRSVLGRAADECSGGERLPAEAYGEALNELDRLFDDIGGWSLFVVGGEGHGFLTGAAPSIGAAETARVAEWLDRYRASNS